MSDVFISYARATAGQAQPIAEALRAAGYSVWIDDDLPAHRAFTEVLAERLAAAKAVVVVWSREAAASQWVQSEADRGREDAKLVQLRIDDTPLPMPFDRINCVDLAGWAGETDAPGWRTVVASIAALAGEPAAAPVPAPAAEPSGPASKPCVAVMPFANLSSDPEQAYFADGMVEDIVSALARFKAIHVISGGAGLAAGGKALSPQDAARRLGVDYLLEGSVRRAADRVRITIHLVDAANGAEMWSERLDDNLQDVFALQDRVAQRVAGGLENRVLELDEQKASARPTANMNSYDLFLRSLPLFRVSRKDEMLQAIDLLDQSLALDPNFGLALSQSCVDHRQVVDHEWTDDPARFRRRGLEMGERALIVGGDDAKVVVQVAAGLSGLDDRLGRAISLSERAIALNPSSGFVWLVSGSIQLRNGDPELAATHLETAMNLDPISTMNSFVRMYLASARFQQGRFDEALALFGTTTMRMPVSYAVLASLHGHLGQIPEAKAALAQLHAVSGCSLEKLTSIWFPRPNYQKLLLDGIAKATP